MTAGVSFFPSCGCAAFNLAFARRTSTCSQADERRSFMTTTPAFTLNTALGQECKTDDRYCLLLQAAVRLHETYDSRYLQISSISRLPVDCSTRARCTAVLNLWRKGRTCIDQATWSRNAESIKSHLYFISIQICAISHGCCISCMNVPASDRKFFKLMY